MRIAFYAPMKPPDHPVPSGDRQIARLLIEALELAGHQVELAARLRSWDGAGDTARQIRLARLGAVLAKRLLRRYQALPVQARPQAWLTYHLYYKAPDWIGPRVSEALGIPYLVAEASVAQKRACGPWVLGHRATLTALNQAAAIIALNPTDIEALPHQDRIELIKPFLDPTPFRAAAARTTQARATLAEKWNLDRARPWLLAVGMMRDGDKLASYRLLAQALEKLDNLDWQLVIAGDGPARGEVTYVLEQSAPGRVRFLGQVAPEDLPSLYAACDLMVWPAINEAYGMALLEAQATGLPVVAGRSGGVAAVVRDGETGLLTAPGDTAAFAQALRTLLSAPKKRHAMANTAPQIIAAEHGLENAARRLDAILQRVSLDEAVEP